MRILITFFRLKEILPGEDDTIVMLHHAGLHNPSMRMKEPVVVTLDCSPRNIEPEVIAERIRNVFSARYRNISELRITFETGQQL